MNPAVAYHNKAPDKLQDGTIVKLDTFGSQSSKPLFNWPGEEEIKQFPPEQIPTVSRLHLWAGKTPNPFLTHIAIELSNGIT